MIQRTKGSLLLALLVITGLAGTFSDNTLTKEERKNAVTVFKESKARILNSTDGLSTAQLTFRPSPQEWSITDCLSHIALAERGMWSMLDSVMKLPASPALRDSIRLKDEQIFGLLTDRSVKRKAVEMLQPDKATWADARVALDEFKTLRNEHIKYVKTTTEDLRNHVIRTPAGYIDGYQWLLFINGHSERHYRQIEAIRANAAFPKS